MKYINAEEFLSQPEEVQQVFRRWWKPEFGDLFSTKMVNNEIDIIINTDDDNIYGLNDTFKGNIYDYVDETLGIIPLFTEGQLRQFIEDKTSCKIGIDIFNLSCCYDIYFRMCNTKFEEDYSHSPCRAFTDNLLQALWQVACQIAIE